ncbi:RebB family R body protein [Photobacterium sp. 1_MG-2023]|uniref:RebB family R body protein n=1 Tax=Photobacterium sp. 1_MG-2023 TaxID=3062646 RepID=UPI0026E31BE7|nr:RebB family R body protein [Photobacterium sp. 1_MG-2023]MDO6708353.1 RebB family R body protein [Photobacterium sp. 1_MG-2023]
MDNQSGKDQTHTEATQTHPDMSEIFSEEMLRGNYSSEMIDTMFADSLSRGMQNAIISQQNAQMVSSSSITNACARILQAKSGGKVTEESTPVSGNTSTPAPVKTTPRVKKLIHFLAHVWRNNKKYLFALLILFVLVWAGYEIFHRLSFSSLIDVNFNSNSISQPISGGNSDE